MNPVEVKEALLLSIKKWEVKAETGELGDLGPENCPLCDLFYWDLHCVGCPIAQATKEEMCSGTPYEEIEVLHFDYMYRGEPYEEEVMKKLIRDEVEFLKSLLPEEL